MNKYMFGTSVTSDWVVGSPIVWKGEWQRRAYEDKLAPDGERTRVTLSQDNNPTEQARERSERYWGTMLAALTQFLER